MKTKIVLICLSIGYGGLYTYLNSEEVLFNNAQKLDECEPLFNDPRIILEPMLFDEKTITLEFKIVRNS